MLTPVQEYTNLVYDNYNTMLLTFPVGVGIIHNYFNAIINQSERKKQTTLVLLRNYAVLNETYRNFCQMVNYSDRINGINNFYEFENGSSVFFKLYNRVEHPIFKYADNVIFYDLEISKCNDLTLEMLSKIADYDKKVFLNCNLKHNVERVLFKKSTDKKYKKDHKLNNLDSITSEIRRLKIKKIKAKCYE